MKRKEIVLNKNESIPMEHIIAKVDKNLTEQNITIAKEEPIIPKKISKAQKLNSAIIEAEWGQTS
ncbi:MAG TPA: hypothetical protein PL018_06265 [Ignavibacteriaceae bacterium]|nr:hypothetical protein [Ignavibacteriaceae bacterium]